MHLDRSTGVAGLDPASARSIVRELTTPKDTGLLARRLEIPEHDLEQRLAALADAGFVQSLDRGGRRVWDVTSEGAALAKANLRKQITRRTADKLVAQVAERAAEYNRTEGFPLSIERVRVFGSYLDLSRDRLGDVDIEIDLGARIDSTTARAYTRRVAPHITSPLDLVYWPEHEARGFLAGRSRSIDFQDVRAGALDTPMRVLYERADDPRAMERR